MKINYVRLSAAVLVAVSISGCATITRGTRQKFIVTSEPSNAEVEMTNGLRCTTPCKLKIPRKSEFLVRVIKPGYETAEVKVHGKVKGGGTAGFVGNALIGGLIGGAVDASTGSALDLVPNPVNVTLKQVAMVAPAAVETPAAAAPATTAPTIATPASAVPDAPATAPAAVVAPPSPTAPAGAAPAPAAPPVATPTAPTASAPAPANSSAVQSAMDAAAAAHGNTAAPH
jgi:PEGA domain